MARTGWGQVVEHGALTLVTVGIFALFAHWGHDQRHASLAIASIVVAGVAIMLAVGASLAMRRVLPATYRWDATDRQFVALAALGLSSLLTLCAAGVAAATMRWDRSPLTLVECLAGAAAVGFMLSVAGIARLMRRRRQLINRARADRAAFGRQAGV